ncbi:MAG: bifunctional 4'-phosphopantothenoylcysteine decarboxylase/phosphopantothenoylcysteine synthetase [Desulfobacteraceae bacterium 4572_130]|nr:MAG: bifunctional 4'-phosphopantothenoylcysteine decarboxylase/phosphopantothenoylcysteine synthetase [Desulfobacteraceae bacterium 4572_130]
MFLKNKTILLGVTGGIAAYKAVELLRLMKKAGADVKVVMTRAARKFVHETTFRILSENDVCTGLFNSKESSVRHIEWADSIDCVVIAPATANIISKIANGLADNALTTIMLAVKSPVMICPSMNSAMYENQAFQRNLDVLEKDGAYILEPEPGELACKSFGPGRLPQPALIFDRLQYLLTTKDMKKKRVLVSAGPTREPIDPVRYISNHSSGKMGYAICDAAEKRGAEVTLISGPVSISPPFGVNLIKIETAQEMAEEILNRMENFDIIIKVAAVADFSPDNPKTNKIKKNSYSNILSLTLKENIDILKQVGKRKKNQFLVGFAAETENLEKNALGKMKKKNLDMIVGNIVGIPESGFKSNTNKVKFFFKDGTIKDIPIMEKREIADKLFNEILRLV